MALARHEVPARWQGSIVRCLRALTRERRQFEPQPIPDPPTSCRGDTPRLASHGSWAVPHAAGDPRQRVGKAWGMTYWGGEDLHLNQEEGQVLSMGSEGVPLTRLAERPAWRHLWFCRGSFRPKARRPSGGLLRESWGILGGRLWNLVPREPSRRVRHLRPSALAADSRTPAPTIHLRLRTMKSMEPSPSRRRPAAAGRRGMGMYTPRRR